GAERAFAERDSLHETGPCASQVAVEPQLIARQREHGDRIRMGDADDLADVQGTDEIASRLEILPAAVANERSGSQRAREPGPGRTGFFDPNGTVDDVRGGLKVVQPEVSHRRALEILDDGGTPRAHTTPTSGACDA